MQLLLFLLSMLIFRHGQLHALSTDMYLYRNHAFSLPRPRISSVDGHSFLASVVRQIALFIVV